MARSVDGSMRENNLASHGEYRLRILARSYGIGGKVTEDGEEVGGGALLRRYRRHTASKPWRECRGGGVSVINQQHPPTHQPLKTLG